MTDVPLPDMPAGPSPEEIMLNALIKRYSELSVRSGEIADEMTVIKSRMRQLGRGKHQFAVGTITVSGQKRFDPELADAVLRAIDPNLVPKCSISKIDAGLVKRVVGEDTYERCQKPSGEDKVVVA